MRDRKRKRVYGAGLFFLIMLFAAACAGGGSSERVVREEGSAVEESSAGEKNSAAEEAEKDWFTLQEELRPSIVQIFCGDYRGSGVVWKITEEEAVLISSGHLLRNGDTCEVLCHAGIYYEAKVKEIREDCDVGFAVIPARALREDEVELRAARPCERGKEELVPGEELAIYGSMDYAAGNFAKGYLIEAEREMQFEGYESAQPLLLGGILRDPGEAGENEPESGEGGLAVPKRGAVDAGMSGCGVFDRQGRLLGILAGGDGEEGFAAVPVWRIVD